jgi:hypothetical protein
MAQADKAAGSAANAASDPFSAIAGLSIKV